MAVSDPLIGNDSVVFTKIVSDSQREMIGLVSFVFLCGVVSALGSVANVINIIVFYQQGLNSTINISFFSLAISDLCSLVLQQLFNVYINPLFLALDLPIVVPQVQMQTTAFPREMFARITCLITAFITAERCLCVVFPLHVKRIITPRVTIAVIAVIFIFTLLSPAPIYCTSYFSWIFYAESNSTLLGLSFTEQHATAEAFVYFLHALFTLLGFLSVIVFTLTLTFKLRQKSEWRQASNVDQEKVTAMSRRDTATIRMVVLIAAILVVCYTPAVLLSLVTFIEPEFSVGGKLINLFYSLWTFGFLFENINSSVNIFLYYRMSSKYRQTFRELFSVCLRRCTDKVGGAKGGGDKVGGAQGGGDRVGEDKEGGGWNKGSGDKTISLSQATDKYL